MKTFRYGPLSVHVDDTPGKLPPPWGGREEWTLNLEVADTHGNAFRAGWTAGRDEPTENDLERAAERIVSLMEQALEDFDWIENFSGGYRGGERSWRRDEAHRLRSKAREFVRAEVTKAAAVAYRRRNYREHAQPKDWSPRRELQ